MSTATPSLADDPKMIALALKIAKAKGRRFPSLADEFEGEALLALVKAAGTYDASRGVTFFKYVAAKVWFAMTDCQNQWVPRGYRRAERNRLKLTESPPVVGSLSTYVDGPRTGESLEMIPSGEDAADWGAEYLDEVEALIRLLETPGQREAFRLLYTRADCIEQAHAGRAMGRSPSRVSQMHIEARAQIAGQIGGAR